MQYLAHLGYTHPADPFWPCKNQGSGGGIREEFATDWDRLAKRGKPDLAGESRLLLELAGAPIRLIPIPRSAGQRRTRWQ